MKRIYTHQSKESNQTELPTKIRLVIFQILFSSIILWTANQSHAQDYVPFNFGEESKWYNGHLAIGFGFSAWVTDALVIDGDSIINDKVYHKLHFEYVQNVGVGYEPIDGEYIGAIREDTLKNIYYFPSSTLPFPGVCLPNDTSEILIYSFELELGDTVFVDNPRYQQIENYPIVEMIDSILIGDEYRKRYTLDVPFNTNDAPYTEQWIEGVGSIHGLLGSIYTFSNNLNNCVIDMPIMYGHLACYSDEFVNFQSYHINISDDCTIYDGISENEGIKFQVSPNPFSKSINVSLSNIGKWSYSINSMDGRMVRSNSQILNEETEINLEEIKSGMYILSIQDNEGMKLASKIIVKM